MLLKCDAIQRCSARLRSAAAHDHAPVHPAAVTGHVTIVPPSLSEIGRPSKLVYEACELGADPIAWRDHLVGGLNALLGSDVAFGGRADWGDDLNGRSSRDKVLRIFSDVGWSTDSEREVYLDWLGHGTPMDNPMCGKLIETGALKAVVARQEVVTQQEWRRAPVIDRLRTSAHIDEAMCSVELLAPGQMLLLAVQRSTGRRPFQTRERRLLELVHDEVRLKLGTRLALFDEPSVLKLPLRLRMTLRCLLEGDGEKQIAARLGVSVHTVHTHVKRLHRQFGVSTKGELMAHCRRFHAVLNQDQHSAPP